jgi:hypothetical protein
VPPGDELGRPHHPLENSAVEGSVVSIPGGDTVRQDALNGASVEVCVFDPTAGPPLRKDPGQPASAEERYRRSGHCSRGQHL